MIKGVPTETFHYKTFNIFGSGKPISMVFKSFKKLKHVSLLCNNFLEQKLYLNFILKNQLRTNVIKFKNILQTIVKMAGPITNRLGARFPPKSNRLE
jgi:hypothetical protein